MSFLGVVAAVRPDSGGIYQYSESILGALLEGDDRNGSHVVLLRGSDMAARSRLHQRGFQTYPLYPPEKSIRRAAKKVMANHVVGELLRPLRFWWKRSELDRSTEIRYRQDVGDHLGKLGVRLLLFPAPDPLAFEAGIPSIMAVHDLQHRLQPEFPEVSEGGEFEVREYLFGNAAEHCLMLLVDSEVGKRQLMELYGDRGITEDRVKVLPFIPPPGLSTSVTEAAIEEVKERLGIPERFFFYPSQFWPHKNHERIVRALTLPDCESFHVVFTGGNTGRFMGSTLKACIRVAQQLGVADRVHITGYVSDSDLSCLYSAAIGLVMPTFFGPTNIPVLEAWNFGLPVITSDIEGIREQVGDAGLLVDPRSVQAIGEAMMRVASDGSLRERLRDAGREQLKLHTQEDFGRMLRQIVGEAEELLASGRGGG